MDQKVIAEKVERRLKTFISDLIIQNQQLSATIEVLQEELAKKKEDFVWQPGEAVMEEVKEIKKK